jgi:hypothetical protein
MFKLSIDRATWLRGEGNEAGASCLLRIGDGKMCVLGKYAFALGMTRDQLRGVPSPIGFNKLHDDLLFKEERAKWLFDGNPNKVSQDAHELMATNDAEGLSETTREQTLIDIFAKHEIELEFV